MQSTFRPGAALEVDRAKLAMLRTLRRAIEKRGNRFPWWDQPPRLLHYPRWWRWTWGLTAAIVAGIVADGPMRFPADRWPPRLP